MERTRIPHGAQLARLRRVNGNFVRTKRALICRRPEAGAARKIQTDLETARMKTAAPVEIALEMKIMPFHAEAVTREASVQRLPRAVDGRPRVAFLARGAFTFVNRSQFHETE